MPEGRVECGCLAEVCGEVGDRPAEQDLDRRRDLGGVDDVGHAGADPGDQVGQDRHGVVAQLGHRGVARLADRDQPNRAGAFLADGEGQRLPAVGERQPGAGALVDREVGPDVGALLEQPAHADVGPAVLLVGHRDEPQVAARPEALASQPRHRDRAGGDLVLHVDRTAAVEEAVVVDDGAERVVEPVLPVDGDDVGVADEGERGCGRVGAGDPRDDVGPLRLARDQLDVDAVAGEVVVEVVGGEGLAAREPAVGGVAPDQLLGDLQHLVGQPVVPTLLAHCCSFAVVSGSTMPNRSSSHAKTSAS